MISVQTVIAGAFSFLVGTFVGAWYEINRQKRHRRDDD